MSGLPNWKTIPGAERDRLLTDFYASGLSAAQIAGKFTDVSRSAVIGRAYRLKLKLKGSAAPKPPQSKAPTPISAKQGRKSGAPGGIPSRSLKRARDAKLNSANITNKAESWKVDPGLPVTITASAAWDALPGIEPITLEHLNSTTCRWPLWEEPSDPRLFCGAECEVERAFCRSHRALAYYPATVRQRAGLRSAERIS